MARATDALGKVVEIVLTILLVVNLTFFMSHAVPGDPARAIAGAFASDQVVSNIRRTYGLDQPLFNQYLIYLSKIFHGDLGTSTFTTRQVLVDISQYLPASVELVVSSVVI